MACFLVPMALAIVTTAFRKSLQGYRIDWLNLMFWGGCAMLAVDHFAHQEIVPWPPFLTAMQNPTDFQVMLHEMATLGTAMTIAIIAVWVVMLALARVPARIVDKI